MKELAKQLNHVRHQLFMAQCCCTEEIGKDLHDDMKYTDLKALRGFIKRIKDELDDTCKDLSVKYKDLRIVGPLKNGLDK